MALLKTIILANGIPVTYHRIESVENVVNDRTYIRILSYLNREERMKEKLYSQTDQMRNEGHVYRMESVERLPYNDTLDIVSAYEYLKTTEKYKDAEDIFEEGDE